MDFGRRERVWETFSWGEEGLFLKGKWARGCVFDLFSVEGKRKRK